MLTDPTKPIRRETPIDILPGHFKTFPQVDIAKRTGDGVPARPLVADHPRWAAVDPTQEGDTINDKSMHASDGVSSATGHAVLSEESYAELRRQIELLKDSPRIPVRMIMVGDQIVTEKHPTTGHETVLEVIQSAKPRIDDTTYTPMVVQSSRKSPPYMVNEITSVGDRKTQLGENIPLGPTTTIIAERIPELNEIGGPLSPFRLSVLRLTFKEVRREGQTLSLEDRQQSEIRGKDESHFQEVDLLNDLLLESCSPGEKINPYDGSLAQNTDGTEHVFTTFDRSNGVSQAFFHSTGEETMYVVNFHREISCGERTATITVCPGINDEHFSLIAHHPNKDTAESRVRAMTELYARWQINLSTIPELDGTICYWIPKHDGGLPDYTVAFWPDGSREVRLIADPLQRPVAPISANVLDAKQEGGVVSVDLARGTPDTLAADPTVLISKLQQMARGMFEVIN